MSDPIMQKLDEMQALTCSSSVPLGVSVARHADRLLAETRLELRKCIAALKAVLEEHRDGGNSQGFFPGDPDYGERDHCCVTCGPLGEYGVEYPCPTVKAVEEALGVES